MNVRNLNVWVFFTFALGWLLPISSFASTATGQTLDLTRHWVGCTALVFLAGLTLLVMAEEFIHLRKSKPVIIAAGIIWLMVAIVYNQNGDHDTMF